MRQEHQRMRAGATSKEHAKAVVRRRRGRSAHYWSVACLSLLSGSSVFAQEPFAVPPVGVMPPSASMAFAPRAARPPAVKPLPQQISALPAATETLDVIQHRGQLVITKANVSRTAVADPSVIEVVQYSPTELSIIGLELGSTTLTLWFENSPEPLVYLVNSIKDPAIEERRRNEFGKLERKLAILFPNSKVYLIPFSGKLVVKGQAHDAEEATHILQIIRGEVASQVAQVPQAQPANANGNVPQQQAANGVDTASTNIVNMLQVPGEFQIMLRVRIAELDRSLLRSKGVNLHHVLFDTRHHVEYLGGSPKSLAGIFENREINAVFSGLISNGTAKVLSEPVLTVMSGHSASFLSGGEFAVPTIVGVEGVGAQQTTFHGFGTSLMVTPIVLDHDLIRMVIVPEFSQLNSGHTVNGIPGVDTRRAQTTVQLREGQTIALAGLISHQSQAASSRVPVLGSIPLVGPSFFAGKKAVQEETELLILVTPEIVRPMDADEVPPVPGHDVTHPNDCDFFGHGLTEGCPDQGVYQVAPYGHGAGAGVQVGYRTCTPATGMVPPSAMSSPVPPVPFGAGTANGGLLPNGGPIPNGPIPNGSGPSSAGPQYPIPRRVFDPPGQPIGPQSSNAGTFNRGMIRTVSGTSDTTWPTDNNQATNASWYQRPFRSFGGPQSTPQRALNSAPSDSAATDSPPRTAADSAPSDWPAGERGSR